MKLDVSFASKFHRPVEAVSAECAAALQSKWDSAAMATAKDVRVPAPPPFSATQLEPWLWVGSCEDARNGQALAQHSITHVLNVAKECDSPGTPFQPQPGVTVQYMQFMLRDHGDEQIVPYLIPAISFIEEARLQGGSVLIHCRQGISRSASFCLAYLMAKHNMSFDQAFSYAQSRRGIINPNLGFVLSLVEFQKVAPRIHDALETSPPDPSPSMSHLMEHVRKTCNSACEEGGAHVDGTSKQERPVINYSHLFPMEFSEIVQPHALTI
jgi:predicted protein tyrosine phosphatase